MTEEYFTRMGDGRRMFMTRRQITDEIHEGVYDAVDASGVPPLSEDEMEHICDVICMKTRMVGVEPGRETVISNDGGQLKMTQDSGGSGVGIDLSRLEAILLHERAYAHDTFELAWTDYSIKAIKPIIANEMQAIEQFNMMVTIPLMYGAMPNMGLYSVPDGPYGNPADLMRGFRVEESRKEAERACDHLARDIAYVTTLLDSAGCEGFNLDTVGSAGDADFVAALRGCEAYRKACPNAYINIGMSSEHVIGLHGEIEYDGKVVAGMYPQDQVKLAAKAGANVFGAVVNTNTCMSYAWNVARAVCMVKECVKQSPIPVHADLGMGVGGVPMEETPPVDSTSRSNKLMIEIAHVDGVQVGVGDPIGMAATHALSGGMGGMRAAGDLVARMMYGKSMKLDDAKEYVAKKLGVTTLDLVDEKVMRELREELGIGTITSVPGTPKGMPAKLNIEKLLDVTINSCEHYRSMCN